MKCANSCRIGMDIAWIYAKTQLEKEDRDMDIMHRITVFLSVNTGFAVKRYNSWRLQRRLCVLISTYFS